MLQGIGLEVGKVFYWNLVADNCGYCLAGAAGRPGTGNQPADVHTQLPQPN